MRTLFPAKTRFAQDPKLMVVKVNLPSRGQKCMSQLSVQPVEAGVQRRPPAVCVIKRVETCKGTHVEWISEQFIYSTLWEKSLQVLHELHHFIRIRILRHTHKHTYMPHLLHIVNLAGITTSKQAQVHTFI